MIPTNVPRRRSGVRALVTLGKRVLLTRERRRDGSIYHSLPGGGVEPGETPHGALARELSEEVGSCSCQHRSIGATMQYDLYAVTLNGVPTPDPSEGMWERRSTTRRRSRSRRSNHSQRQSVDSGRGRHRSV
jgi:predicted NUDIX family NTP pyrophosphohydrolase